MNVYLPFVITGLALFGLVVILGIIARAYPRIKYISISSIISFVLVLLLIMLRCYAPYTGWLNYLYGALVFGLYLLPFAITFGVVKVISLIDIQIVQGVNFEEPIWQCIVFAISFVFSTFLIFLVIKIALFLKKKFRSGMSR